MASHYEFMGLEVSCSGTDIRSKYKEMAKELHPDKGGDPESFKKLAEAHTVLSDPRKRAAYDSTLHSRHNIPSVNLRGSGSGSVFNIPIPIVIRHPVFKAAFGIFSEWSRSYSNNANQRKSERHSELVLSVLDVYLGKTKTICALHSIGCRHCKGIEAKCGACWATGHKTEFTDDRGYIKGPCQECNGQGRRICAQCNGRGVMSTATKIKIEFPLKSSVIDVEPEGTNLVIHSRIVISPHGNFKLESIETGTLRLNIPCPLAAGKATATDVLDIVHLDGQGFSVRCQALPGTSHTIQGQGCLFWNSQTGQIERGPLIIDIDTRVG